VTNRDYQNFLRAHSIIDAVGERADRAYTHVTSFDFETPVDDLRFAGTQG